MENNGGEPLGENVVYIFVALNAHIGNQLNQIQPQANQLPFQLEINHVFIIIEVPMHQIEVQIGALELAREPNTPRECPDSIPGSGSRIWRIRTNTRSAKS